MEIYIFVFEKAQCGSFRKINLPEMPDFYQFKCSHEVANMD